MPTESLFSSREAAVWPAVVSECKIVVWQGEGGQTFTISFFGLSKKWANLRKWLWQGWHRMVITVASQQEGFLLDPYSRSLSVCSIFSLCLRLFFGFLTLCKCAQLKGIGNVKSGIGVCVIMKGCLSFYMTQQYIYLLSRTWTCFWQKTAQIGPSTPVTLSAAEVVIAMKWMSVYLFIEETWWKEENQKILYECWEGFSLCMLTYRTTVLPSKLW